MVDDFVAEYAAGRTPNPCLRCNEKIKFEAVLDRALALGFDAVCTGHYARIDGDSGALRRAVDAGKDQSYVLAVLTRDQIAHAMFPLGDTPKTSVRAEAAERGLLVADKPDSHDVCFIADGDTQGFLARQLGVGAGLDRRPRRHGARLPRGRLRVHRRAAQGAAARPARPGRQPPLRAVHRAGQQHRHRRPGRRALGHRRSRRSARSGPGARAPQSPVECSVQLRAHGEVYPCVAWLAGDELVINLRAPARAVAAGQAAVLYDGDTVLGSATISAAR